MEQLLLSSQQGISARVLQVEEVQVTEIVVCRAYFFESWKKAFQGDVLLLVLWHS